jgi:hypothetical protein
MINSPPKVTGLTVDLDEYLVEMALSFRIITHWADPFPTKISSEHWAETVPPISNCFMANVDATLVQQILDIAKRQGKTNIHHHRKANDFWRSFEIAEWICHLPNL